MHAQHVVSHHSIQVALNALQVAKSSLTTTAQLGLPFYHWAKAVKENTPCVVDVNSVSTSLYAPSH